VPTNLFKMAFSSYAAGVTPPQSIMLKEKGLRELVSVKQFREWNIPVVAVGADRACGKRNLGRTTLATSCEEIIKRAKKQAGQSSD
jgi:hypothetical protein